MIDFAFDKMVWLNKNMRFAATTKTPVILAVTLWVCVVAGSLQPTYSFGAPLETLPLDQLLKQSVSLHQRSQTASAVRESTLEAPATLVVIEAKDFKRRGYTGLDDVLADLPGFDTVNTNGTMQTVAYQRGYRTPWLQRTLLLIDGRVDNNLWNHSAQLSRQYPIAQIERVEVLYGPASAVYGPNAFLGVINVITFQGKSMAAGSHEQIITAQAGSFKTQALDLLLRGNSVQHDFSYRIGARGFVSDEPGLDDYSPWGYNTKAWLADSSIWGAGIGLGVDSITHTASPLGDINLDGKTTSDEYYNGEPLGQYADPSNNHSLFAQIDKGGLSIGGFYWRTDEGFGPYYSFADAAPNGIWLHDSKQLYVNYKTAINNPLAEQPITSKTDVVWRSNQSGGDWVESFGGYVSLSDWLSTNDALRVTQQFDVPINANTTVSTGFKWEHKHLTKVYNVCNYWDGAGICPKQADSSSTGEGSDGSGVLFVNDINSQNYTARPPPATASPSSNLLSTIDRAAFAQLLWQKQRWRINTGLRLDDNSIYGQVVTPRGAAIYQANAQTTVKFIYGEAFQEPSAKDLYGGWNGRQANPNLVPERARNAEVVGIYQQTHWQHQASLYAANYRNVIAGGQNVGRREIRGLEYRGNYRYANAFTGFSHITGHLYYTFTQARADHHYNNVTGLWQAQWASQGDISPHKLQGALNLPLSSAWNINLKAGWFSSRNVFSQNPLRQAFNLSRNNNRKVPAYTKVDMASQYQWRTINFSIGIENLFEETYWHPGVESAGSGDNFTTDNDGFQNSLISQVNKRIYTARVEWRLQ